jgi:hypothetical protein
MTPVAVVVEYPLVAALHLDRLQDHAVTRKAHQPFRIDWGLVEIYHHLLRRCARVDREVDAPGQTLIASHVAEAMTGSECYPFVNTQFDPVVHGRPLQARKQV